jgi:VWFA-related protein
VLVHSDGEPVPDLKAADFSLSDSGVLQNITSVESDARALDLTVVVQETTQTKSGKYQALDTEISALAKALTPADRLTVMLAGRDPRPFTPPGTRNLVRESELQRRCQPVYDTLARALMQPALPDRQRVVILMTAGEGRGGFLSTRPAAEIARWANARLYVARLDNLSSGKYIAEAVCPAVSMDFSKEREDRLRFLATGGGRSAGNDQFERLAAIAESTGGREIRAALFRESTVGPLRDMLEEVRGSYVLRYTSRGVPESGWHPLTVKVTRPGSYDIRARTGYER